MFTLSAMHNLRMRLLFALVVAVWLPQLSAGQSASRLLHQETASPDAHQGATDGSVHYVLGRVIEPLPKASNTTCSNFVACDDCVNSIYDSGDDYVFVSCVWCSPSDSPSACVAANEVDRYCEDTDQYMQCDTSYYTYIFVVVVGALICLCCCSLYMRKYRERDHMVPLLPSAARHFLWRRSFSQGKQDWMCIICGFDNKTSNEHCSMCGTSHQFSINYKAEKREMQDGQIAVEPKANTAAGNYDFSTGNNGNSPGGNYTNHAIQSPLKMPTRGLSADTWRDTGYEDALASPSRSSLGGASLNGGISGHQLAALQVWPPRTTPAARDEAFHYRRLNNLSLRQKAGRRRRMWQRVYDSEIGGLKWVRAPPQKTMVGEAKMGYTPRASFDGAAAIAKAAGEENMNSTMGYGHYGNFTGDEYRRNSPRPPAAATQATEGGWLSSWFGGGTSPTPAPAAERDGNSVGRPSSLTDDGDINSNTGTYPTGHSQRARTEAGYPPHSRGAQLSSRGRDELREALLGAVEGAGGMLPGGISSPPSTSTGNSTNSAEETTKSIGIPSNRSERSVSADSFGDSVLLSGSPGYTSVFNYDTNTLEWKRVEHGLPVAKVIAPPPKAISAGAANKALSDQSNQPYNPKPGLEPNRLKANLLKELESVDLVAIAAMSFKEKQLWFLDQMGKLQKPWTEGCIRMEVGRDSILTDSLKIFGSTSTSELHKWIRVQFRGEPGVDAGGLEREWFTLVVNELFNSSTGLFTCSSAESLGGAYHVNPTSGYSQAKRHLELFTLAGRVMGKAIMEQQAIAATLSLPLRKQILTLPITFSDLEFVDPLLYRNLKFLESYDDIEGLSLDFTVNYPVINTEGGTGGSEESVVFELKPGGSNIAVTRENREEYLQLLLANRMLTSIQSQVEYLLSGLYEIIPPDLLSIFDYQELELLMCGVPDIDVSDWRNYTEYMGGYQTHGPKHRVIKWFWNFVEGCSGEEKARLVQFVTGCSRLPAQGFKALVSNDGKLRKFNIQSISKMDSMYPRSHTCFNKLDLPMYDSSSELEAYMSCVISSDVFGFTIE